MVAEGASEQSYYDLLGLELQATTEQIRAAYRRLALLLHPDRHHGDSSAFILLKQAVDVLSDPISRALYDESLLDKLMVLHRLWVEEYLDRCKDFLCTVQGLSLPVHSSTTPCCSDWGRAPLLPLAAH